MRSPLWFGAAVLVALSIAAACGGDDDGAPAPLPPGEAGTDGGMPSVDARPPATPKEACEEYITQTCLLNARCSRRSEPDPACLAYRELCPEYFFSPGAMRTPESLLECASQFATQSCDDYIAGVEQPCQTPGTLAGGEPCLYTPQCASLRCNSNGSSCATCLKLYEPGADCTVGSGEYVCPPNQKCDPVARRCVAITPPVVTAIGSACATDGAPSTCVYGSYCDPSSGTCKEVPKLARPGEACGVVGSIPVDCDAALGKCINGRCVGHANVGEKCGDVRFDGGAHYVSCLHGAACVPLSGGSFCSLAPARRGEKCADPGTPCISTLRCVEGTCVLTEYDSCISDAGRD